MATEVSELTGELTSFDRAVATVIRWIPGRGKVAVSPRTLVAARGSAWTMAGFGASQIFRLLGQLILARILIAPEAFGLAALVTVFLSGLEMLSDLGINTDVVQSPRGDDPLFVNTAFLIQAGRGAMLCAVAAAFAYPFATFYHQPLVRPMIFLAAASLGIRNLASGSILTMTRHVQLGKVTMLNAGGDAAGLVVSVLWAVVSPTAWALVVGRVASSVVYTVGSHIVAERPMSFEWDSNAARDILSFGTGMFLSSATYFLSTEAERLVVGKFITVQELGCFSIALAISWAPSRIVQRVVAQVFFPLIARASREDRATAVKDYRKVRVVLFVLSLVLACGFILLGPLIVRLLVGSRYADAGWMLQLLGFRAALELFSAATTSLLFAVGVSKYSAIGNAAKATFLCVGLAIAFGKYGFREAIWVMALSQLANYLPHFWGLRREFIAVTRTEITYFVLFLSCTAATASLVSIAY